MAELYIQYEYWIAAAQLIFAMLGMGATLTANDFKQVIRFPRTAIFGLLAQLFFVPTFAFIFINTVSLEAGLIVGIALIASIPGGTTSNIFTYMARGNVPLSISITGITSLACLVTTPLILSVLVIDYLPVDFSMPTQRIISDIALTLLLPLFIGLSILHYLPKYANNVSKWSIRLSLVGILLIVVGSIIAGRLDINAFGTDNLLIVTAFIIFLSVMAALLSRLLKLAKSDGTAIKMEVVVRNVNLAVLIKVSLFPAASGSDQIGNFVLSTILVYGSLQLLFAALLIITRRFFN